MKKWIRFMALVLVIATVAGILLQASAANVASDVNGDGKITVFDAQLIAESNAGLRTFNKQQLSVIKGMAVRDILSYILGNTELDAGDTDGDGIQEIYTADGLQRLHTASDGNFILMSDIDLDGADWTPVANFSGTFDGNGKTISNFTINTSVVDTHSPSIYNQGFFADTTYDAVIQNLHLQNVALNVADNANNIGFFAGSLSGDLTGCTVVGTLNDTRETYPSDVYTGVMAGKLTTGSDGTITGGTALSISDEFGVHTTENLCANVKLNITNDEINLRNNKKNKVGLTGYTDSASAVTGQWTETTYSSSLLSETIQARQEKVVDYMTAMATVAWTPAENMCYTAANGTDQNYFKGRTYYGLPYNGHNGSLERFLSVMQPEKVTDADGVEVYMPQDNLVLNCGYDEDTETWTDTGFYLTMGNDCSGAVNWAWMQVSNVVTEDGLTHNVPYKGGVYVLTTNVMIPNDANRIPKGIYQVGSWETSTTDTNGKWVSAPFDASKAAYQCTTETYSPEVLQSNGIDTILEAYAQTHKADGVVCYVSQWSSKVANGGHARLVVADPVVIRNANGSIDPNASYMLLTEQGVGFDDKYDSHWNVNKKHTFFELTGKAVEGAITTSTKTYLPITIRALREDEIRETYLVQDPKGSVTSPVTGSIYSYHHINSITATITDAAGKVYYDHEAFTGISLNYNTYRGRNNSQKMEALHGATFAAAAKATGMVPGKTYYFTVDVLLSTGEIIHAVETPKAFTYTE